jgi:hypothetical protein
MTPLYFFRPFKIGINGVRSSLAALRPFAGKLHSIAQLAAAPLVGACHWLSTKIPRLPQREQPVAAAAELGSVSALANNGIRVGPGETRSLAQIRQRLCKQVYTPPYKARAKGFTFIFRGDASAIRTKVLQPALATDYRPANLLDDFFALTWVHYDHFSSSDPPDSNEGRHCYKESAVFSVIEDPNDGTQYIYIPSLYVDKSAPIASGNTFGFPKSWGDITMTSIVPDAAGHLTLSTKADEVRTFGPPGSPFSERLTVYEATRGAIDASIVEWIPNVTPEKVEDFAAFLEKPFFEFLAKQQDMALPQTLKQLFDLFVFWKSPLLLLKQVPSAVAPLQAAYQAYVKVDAKVDAIHNVALLGGYQVTFQNWDSAPFVTAFGLSASPARAQPSLPIKPLLGFYADLDVQLTSREEMPI